MAENLDLTFGGAIQITKYSGKISRGRLFMCSPNHLFPKSIQSWKKRKTYDLKQHYTVYRARKKTERKSIEKMNALRKSGSNLKEV